MGSLHVQTAPAPDDPRLRELLDDVFERSDRESRLVAVLGREHPGFRQDWALLATVDGRAAGYALFLPRELRLRGEWVQMVVSSPFGVRPTHRQTGVGRALLDEGLTRAREAGARGAVVLGGQRFFAAAGYAPAFRLHTLRARTVDLPAADDRGWRGLQGGDLLALPALFEANYAECDGAERRAPIALEWESQIAEGHTRVCERNGRVIAYLRFRTDGELVLRDVCALGPEGVEALLGQGRALAEGHGQGTLHVHCPPHHPVARALFHRGALAECSDFGGEAQLAVIDWPGMLRDLGPSLERGLRAGDGRPLSLGVGGHDYWLHSSPLELRLEARRDPSRHLHLPPELAPSLLTGHRSWRDLAEHSQVQRQSVLDERGWHAVRQLFPGGEPHWTYGPVFEIADR
jgi:predicted N-acetyltransferase YhbS